MVNFQAQTNPAQIIMLTKMRYLILAVAFIAIIIGCQKDPIENENSFKNNVELTNIDTDSSNYFRWIEEFPEDRGSRFGNTAPLFFIGSVTLDNQNMQNQARTQTAFNYKLIDSIKLIRIGTSTASVQYSTNGLNGVSNQPIISVGKYSLEILFKGEIKYENFGDVVTKVVGTKYVYSPKAGLLYNVNSYRWVKTSRLAATRNHFHLFNGKIKQENLHEITTSDGIKRNEYLESTITTSVFMFNHLM